MKKEFKIVFIILILFLVLLIFNNLKQEEVSGNLVFNNIKNVLIKPVAEDTVKDSLKDNLNNYDDVLVVININDEISREIGEYFSTSRHIPDRNIVYVDVPNLEEIDTQTFNDLRSQIETHIINYNLQEQINYIVTTKGVPLKIHPTGDTCFASFSRCASVNSELTLILGPYANQIGEYGWMFSPYYQQNRHFSRRDYGIYLTTRLDGYNFDQIKAMIDKSAEPIFIQRDAVFIFDKDPTRISNLNTNMESANSILISRGYNSILDNEKDYLTNKKDVIGYTSWGSNDYYWSIYRDLYRHTGARPFNNWHPGALAETYVSSSGRTFNGPPISYQGQQSLVADLIAEGVTGVKGYVYEPFASSMTSVNILFASYTRGYNLAESFYTASHYLSWMDVVIGDPKTSISNYFKPTQYTLSVARQGTGQGTVTSYLPPGINCGNTCSFSYDDGTRVHLDATPSSGSTFTGWSSRDPDPGLDCRGASTCVVSMTQDRSVTATFTIIDHYTLDAELDGLGRGTVTSNPPGINCIKNGTNVTYCSANYNPGTIVTLTAAPFAGSTFAGWSSNPMNECYGTGICTLTMNRDKWVAATFNRIF